MRPHDPPTPPLFSMESKEAQHKDQVDTLLLFSRCTPRGLADFEMRDTEMVNVYLVHQFLSGKHHLSEGDACDYMVQRVEGLSVTRGNNPSTDCRLLHLSKLRQHGLYLVLADDGESSHEKLQAASAYT